MRIGIDIDNTLHPFHQQLEQIAQEKGRPLDYLENRYYDYWEERDSPEFYESAHGEKSVSQAVPYPNAASIIQSWADLDHQIYYSSARPQDAYKSTLQWLKAHGFACKELICCTNSDGSVSHSKSSFFSECRIDLVIDDHPNVMVEALLQGLHVAAIEHPWNINFRAVQRVTLAPDWKSLSEKLENQGLPGPNLTRTEKILHYLLGG